MRTEMVPELMVAFGMTEREAKLYVAMIEKPEWRSGELHRITGIPRTQTHQSLELMVSRHYCTRRSEGRFNFYRATPPETLYDILSHRWEDEISHRISRAESAVKMVSGIYQEAMEEDRSLDFIEIIQTPHRIHQRYTELMLATQEEHLSIDRSPYSFITNYKSIKGRNQQMDANEVVAKRGVKLRTIVMYEPDIWSFMQGAYDKLAGESIEELRVADSVPIKLGIFDRNTVMMCVNIIPSQQETVINEIIIHDTAIADACFELFELHWDRAEPYADWRKKHKDK